MAYISIIDLPELQNKDIKGTEYLLVTNTDLESNKLQMDSMTDYISNLVTDKINADFDERLNNAVTNSKVTVFDEGIEVGLANKINFIGATVNSFVNEDDFSIDVYIPSASISSHFNTQDGATNAKVINALTENRFISRPAFDGAPFRIGNWVPGTLQKCVKDNISYIINDSIFIDKVCTFKFYIKQNNEIIDDLELVPVNGVYQSNFISATITNKTKELSHNKCNLSFTFNLKDSIKGRFLLKAEYAGTSGIFTFLEDEIFFDNNLVQAEITTSASFNTRVDKFLSGVKYIGNNSTIKIDAVLKNAKNYTFPSGICDFDGSYCGLSIYNLSISDINLVDFTYNTDVSFSKEYTLLNNKFFNSNLLLKSRVNDWSKGNYIETNFSGLVDTFVDNSTRVYEDFVSETNRLNLQFSTFPSTSILSNNDLQVYSSKLVYPQIDFSSFYNNPDYSSLTGNRQYIRKFWHSNVSHSNGLFSITSNIKEEDLNTKVKIEISLDSINWFNCCSDYLGGVLVNDSGCRINSDSNSLNINNKIEFTLGLNKFTNAASNWGIYIKITFLEAAKDKYIDVLQITNW